MLIIVICIILLTQIIFPIYWNIKEINNIVNDRNHHLPFPQQQTNQNKNGELLNRHHAKVICNKHNTTGAPCGAGTACHSVAPEFIPFVMGYVLLDLMFFMYCFVYNCLSLEQELLVILEYLSSSHLLWVTCCSISCFLCSALYIIVCPWSRNCLSFWSTWVHPSCYGLRVFLCSVLYIIVCPLVLCYLFWPLYCPFWFADSD